jgi:hypothetical protein
MGILLATIWLCYAVIALVIFLIVRWLCKIRWVVILVAVILILIPFRRLIFYKTVYFFYGRSPLKEVHRTVDYPGSVYWEDNVWPGFKETYRRRMVEDYLDGIHLKALAMNGEDGKIYLYRAHEDSFEKSDRLKPALEKFDHKVKAMTGETARILRGGADGSDLMEEIEKLKAVLSETAAAPPPDLENGAEPVARSQSGSDNKALRAAMKALEELLWDYIKTPYVLQKRIEVEAIMRDVEVLDDRSELPFMNYWIEFNLLPKTLIINNNDTIHADRVSIVEKHSEKEIAYSVRYMAFDGIYSVFGFDYRLGDIYGAYKIDDEVLFEYANVRSSWDSGRSYLKHIFRGGH